MKKRDSLTQERLKELIHYNPATGTFIWRLSRSRCKNNGDKLGYILISICGVRYFAHRLVWLYMTGKWPVLDIDHKNGVSSDNRWENIREVPHIVNMQNQHKPQKHNTTGFLGVSKHRNGFQAQIRIDYKLHYLGKYLTPELAYEAYLKAKRELHPGCTI